jgi:predicted lipid-binding transport protein (Tim44 family)
MVVDAFAKGDGKVLKSLLDGPVYENFASAIREREKVGHTLETTLVGIDEAEIVSAEVQGRNVIVTVKFVTGQVNATRDASDEIVDGDANKVVQVTDIWTFGRDTNSSDPNWVLIATGSSS